jgi:hypothetical protein
MAYISRQAVLLEQQRQRYGNCIHESAHCLAILVAFGTGHVNRVTETVTHHRQLPNDVAGKLVLCAAGLTAERLAGCNGHGGGSAFDEGRSDVGQAYRIMAGDTDAWRCALDRANEICRQHWPFIEQLAQELAECGELDGRRVDGMWRLYLHRNPDLVTREAEMRYRPGIMSAAPLQNQPAVRASPEGPQEPVKDDDGKVIGFIMRTSYGVKALDRKGYLLETLDNYDDALARVQAQALPLDYTPGRGRRRTYV